MLASYSEYFIHLAILVLLYSMLAQSFNLIFGLGRLLNFAHVASYAIGAYVTALCSVELESGFTRCLLLSMIVCVLFATLIGSIALRLTKDYFAIGSIAFSAIITALLINWKDLTRGVLGIPGIPRPELMNVSFEENSSFLTMLLLLVIFIQAILYLLFNGKLGRSLRAQAEFEQATSSLGINARLSRNLSFMAASGVAGICGCIYAYYINYVDPSSFSINESIFIISIVVVGKPGSFFGVLASTLFLVLLPEPLRFLDISPSVLGPMRQLLHAAILFTVIFVRRNKLVNIQRTV